MLPKVFQNLKKMSERNDDKMMTKNSQDLV